MRRSALLQLLLLLFGAGFCALWATLMLRWNRLESEKLDFAAGGFQRSLGSVRSNYAARSEGPQLFVIVRVLRKHLANLPALLLSLLAAPPSNGVRVRIVLACTYYRTGETDVDDIARVVNSLVPGAPVSVSAHDNAAILTLFPELAPWKQWAADGGYILTDVVLQEFLRERERGGGGYPTDAVLVTNGDNMYIPKFVTAVTEELERGADIVATHFTSHYNWTEEAVARFREKHHLRAAEPAYGPVRSGLDPEMVLTKSLTAGTVDLGAVVVRTELFVRLGRSFVVDQLARDPSGESIDFVQADGNLFSYFASTEGTRVVVKPPVKKILRVVRPTLLLKLATYKVLRKHFALIAKQKTITNPAHSPGAPALQQVVRPFAQCSRAWRFAFRIPRSAAAKSTLRRAASARQRPRGTARSALPQRRHGFRTRGTTCRRCPRAHQNIARAARKWGTPL
jgi:hypothetical protein